MPISALWIGCSSDKGLSEPPHKSHSSQNGSASASLCLSQLRLDCGLSQFARLSAVTMNFQTFLLVLVGTSIFASIADDQSLLVLLN